MDNESFLTHFSGPCPHAAYLATNRFLWNSGMFIWRAAALEKAFSGAAADMLPMIEKVARLKDAAAVMRREYPSLRRISFDYTVMEKCEDILVVSAGFKWGDVGSWPSAAKYLAHDDSGNARLGNKASVRSSFMTMSARSRLKKGGGNRSENVLFRL